MGLPRITLITPSYNQAEFLEATLRSVLGQGYPFLQYGVVDGGSTDGALEILRRYRRQLSFLIVERDRGQSEAINKGLRQADGEVVGWLNSDDTLLPGALLKVARHFHEHPRSAWLIGRCRAIDAAGKWTPYRGGREGSLIRPAGEFTLPGVLLRRPINVPQPATFWRRKVTQRVGLLDEGLHHCMDFDLWCRFLAAGYRPTVAEDELATYRYHPQSKSCAEGERFIAALIAVEERYLPRLGLAERWALRRAIGYQKRALALKRCAGRPWGEVLRRPWWLGSQQVWRALWARAA